MSGINSAKSDNCLVVGNGESRKKINLNYFKEHYTLIGCNALHRDIISDYLVCCDRRMVEEAIGNESSKDSKIYVRDEWFHYFRKIRKNKNIFELPEIPYSPKYRQDEKRNWGSGTYAVLLSCQLGFKNINLIGFDLYPNSRIENKIKNGGYVFQYNHETVNNLYKDTENYSSSDSQPVDPSNWVYQIAQTFSLYPNINFTVINKQEWNMPREWLRLNVKFKNLNDFLIDNKYSCSTISL